jgi:hypothetical protein
MQGVRRQTNGGIERLAILLTELSTKQVEGDVDRLTISLKLITDTNRTWKDQEKMITTIDKIGMLDTHRENAAHDLLGRPSHRLTKGIEALEILLHDR